MHPSKRPLVILLGFTALLAGLVAVLDPVTVPMPGYMDGIREWAANGRIPDTFTPLAYPLFGGIGYRLGAVHGLLAVQALLHVAIAATAYAILRRLQLPPHWSALASVPLVIHPDLLLSVSKVWDVALSTEMYLLIALTLLQLAPADRLGRNTTYAAAIAGLALGAGMSSRPNFLLLAPLLAWAAYRAQAQSRPRQALAACTLLITTAAGFVALGVGQHGKPFFPGNGPYNLYAGHNDFTAGALLQQENAEPSIVPAYQEALQRDAGLPHLTGNSGDYFAANLQPFYTRSALSYAFHNPTKELKLAALKLFTLFRPDTKVHALASAGGLVKAALALPVLLFATALFWRPRLRLHAMDRALLLLDVLYVIPFLLTNADPRFRTPLDALLLLQLARVVWLRRGAPAQQAVL